MAPINVLWTSLDGLDAPQSNEGLEEVPAA